MFFALSILSMLSYTINNALLVDFARKMDSLSITVYRNLSLAITMTPVLLFVEPGSLGKMGQNWWLILVAALAGAVSLGFRLAAYNYIPVGIASALDKFRVIFIAILAYVFLGETLNSSELINVLIIIIGTVFLGLQNNKMPHLNEKSLKGYFYLGMNVISIGTGFFCFSLVSRNVDPLLAGYLWESLIGIFAFILVVGRQITTGKKFQIIPKKDILKIALIVSPTVIGTAAFALAVKLGDIAVASAIGATGTVLMTIYSHYYHHEKLDFKQWLGILIVIGGVIGLNIFG